MRSNLRWQTCKIALIAGAFFAWDLWCFPRALIDLSDTIRERDGWFVTYLYLTVSLTAYFAIAYLITTKAIGLILFGLLLTSHLVSRCFSVLTFSEFTVNDFEILLRAYANKYQALRFYLHDLQYPIIQSLVAYFVILICAKLMSAQKESSRRATSGAMILLLLIVLLFATLDHSKAKVLPSTLQVPSSAIEFYTLPFYNGPREKVTNLPAKQRYPLHIVMIMDESIRGDYLQVNDFPIETTPFIAALGEKFINLGTAVSMTNLTYTANYAVFGGLKRSQLPDFEQRSRRNSTLFQYAEEAGRKVHILFSAMHLSDFQDWTETFNNPNFRVEMVKSYPSPQVDRHFIDELEQITAADEPTFTWINKWGCHIPYSDNYPPETLNQWWRHRNADQSVSRVRSEYIKCVKWQVDDFMAELYLRLKGREIIMVYSSDHGESLDLTFSRTSHGQLYEPPSEQANIPLMLFALNDHTSQTIQNYFVAENVNRMHASQIFPSLLKMFGYEQNILKRFDPTIFESSPQMQRQFLSGSLWGFGRAFVSNYGRSYIGR